MSQIGDLLLGCLIEPSENAIATLKQYTGRRRRILLLDDMLGQNEDSINYEGSPYIKITRDKLISTNLFPEIDPKRIKKSWYHPRSSHVVFGYLWSPDIRISVLGYYINNERIRMDGKVIGGVTKLAYSSGRNGKWDMGGFSNPGFWGYVRLEIFEKNLRRNIPAYFAAQEKFRHN